MIIKNMDFHFLMMLAWLSFQVTAQTTRDFFFTKCSVTLSLSLYNSATLIWDPPESQCTLIVKPFPHKVKVSADQKLPIIRCSVDESRWLCSEQQSQPTCSALLYSTQENVAGQLWDNKEISFQENYLKFFSCGQGFLRLKLSTEEEVPLRTPSVFVSIVLPMLGACLLGIILTMLIVAAMRRSQIAALVRQRYCCQQERQQTCAPEDQPPNYEEYSKYPLPSALVRSLPFRASASSSAPPDYNQALQIIRDSHSMEMLSASDLAGCVNQAYAEDVQNDIALPSVSQSHCEMRNVQTEFVYQL